MSKKTAVIIGAGPAGLTAAYELLKRTDIHPVVFERDPEYVGGISRTVKYKGNSIDIGGHRFFSKSDRVMRWWSEILPVAISKNESGDIMYQNTVRTLIDGMKRTEKGSDKNVFEVRPRKTRILYKKKFFAYPVEVSLETLKKLGPRKTLKIAYTYLYSTLFPIRPETSLEDFFINRFGRELYETFFKTYTEKVWGVSCKDMSAEWGTQRIKGLSISKAILHAIKKTLHIGPLSGKSVETSLIEQFLYPTLGPGLLWETVAQKIRKMGGEIMMGTDVVGVEMKNGKVVGVTTQTIDGKKQKKEADYVFSTTDIKALIQGITPSAPVHVRDVAHHLEYRDFITVGLLLDTKPKELGGKEIIDTWIYIHEDGVRVGRIQLFHNWHPNLVADQKNGWVGMEYFCNEGDTLWQMGDKKIHELAKEDLMKIGLANKGMIIDGVVIRQKKAYPGYFGAYERFDEIRKWLDSIPNLFPIGRNGMHRYNNQDHSMLAAMAAVDLIVSESTDKQSLWEINTEEEYHEQKSS